MRPVRIALLLAALGAAQAQAGVFDDDEARRQIADHRIKTEARFDQQAKAQLDLSTQIQRQAEEIARLRGQIETLEAPASATAADPSGAAPATASADPAKESQEYEAALNQFKAGKYKDAAAGFAAFVQKYPASSLAPNAQYWLGNAWYAQRDCKRAIEAQSVVTTKYADSPKAPDAWLAMSTCQQEMGSAGAARRSLESLIAKYPSAPAAETARERLKKK
jgi:tol-pal system protein YbgF